MEFGANKYLYNFALTFSKQYSGEPKLFWVNKKIIRRHTGVVPGVEALRVLRAKIPRAI